MAEETFAPKNIIVTGGCGFIGSNFVRFCAVKIVSSICVSLSGGAPL